MPPPADYFAWHYLYAPRRLWQIAGNFLVFFHHYFSINLLLRTFFAPFKRKEMKKRSGFSPADFLSVAFFNFVSRLIGTLIRTAVIFTWLGVEILTLALFIFLGLVWILTPGLTLPLFYRLGEKPDPTRRLLEKGITEPSRIFGFLSQTATGHFVLPRLGISQEEISRLTTTPTPAEKLSAIVNHSPITSANIFANLSVNWPPLKKLLIEKGIEPTDVWAVCQWYEREQERQKRAAAFWERENLLACPGIGHDWTYGYTPNLDQYTEDLSRPLPFSHHLVGREKVTDQMQRILARAEGQSLLLVGEPGTGRRTIILELASRIRQGKITPCLAHQRILLLNLTRLIGEGKSANSVKSLVEEIFSEAIQAGNIILAIDNVDLYVSSDNGRLDLTSIFTKAIREKIRLIGITTFKDYSRYLETNPSLVKYFEKVETFPPTAAEALLILQNTVGLYEKRNRVLATFPALKEIVKKADQYVIDIPFPEKAIDLLDEVCVYAAERGIKIITPQQVDELISEKTEIPVGELAKKEVRKLADFEKIIHQRLVNQEKAAQAIARALRRARVGVAQAQKPIGTFLFLGPTGVGKTETAKALAEGYFGSENRMIRFDMSEYQGEEAIERIIGSSQTGEPGLFAEAIRQNPFSLLLLDEIEKANPKILNLFLVLLDEGYFSDAFGRKVDGRNLIIIGTSNAGTELIRERISEKTEDTSEAPTERRGVVGAKGRIFDPKSPSSEVGKSKIDLPEQEILDYILKQGLFSPEFINRFDAVVVYQPLTEANLKDIARLMLLQLNQRLVDKKVSVKITDRLVARLAKLGYDPALGARPMRRLIQDEIEDQVAQKILRGEVKQGEEIMIEI